MICSKCGKHLENKCSFCTECGNKVSVTNDQTQSNKTTKNNKIVEEIKSFIDRFGDTKINKYVSIATIISMISIRLFGVMVLTALITITNSVLIYYNYRNIEKILKQTRK